MRQPGLFARGPLSRHCGKLVENLRATAARLPLETLAEEGEAVSELCNRYEMARVELAEPTTAVADQPPGEVLVTVNVPFTGCAEALQFMPNTFTSRPPQGRLDMGHRSGNILLEYGPLPSAQLDPDTVKQWRQREVDELRKWTSWVNQDLDAFSVQVAEVARQAVEQRKAHLLRQQSLRDELS